MRAFFLRQVSDGFIVITKHLKLGDFILVRLQDCLVHLFDVALYLLVVFTFGLEGALFGPQ